CFEENRKQDRRKQLPRRPERQWGNARCVLLDERMIRMLLRGEIASIGKSYKQPAAVREVRRVNRKGRGVDHLQLAREQRLAQRKGKHSSPADGFGASLEACDFACVANGTVVAVVRDCSFAPRNGEIELLTVRQRQIFADRKPWFRLLRRIIERVVDVRVGVRNAGIGNAEMTSQRGKQSPSVGRLRDWKRNDRICRKIVRECREIAYDVRLEQNIRVGKRGRDWNYQVLF